MRHLSGRTCGWARREITQGMGNQPVVNYATCMMTRTTLLASLVSLISISSIAAAKQATTAPSVVHITIDSSKDRVPISPYIYGANQHAQRIADHPLTRIGGNRWTAYNWENNA